MELQYWRAFIALTLAVSVIGCSRSGFESSVSGRVTLDDKPIGPGSIVFASAQEGGGNPSNGTIQVGGNYTLKTANTPGLHPGKYKVAVSMLDSPNPPPGVRDFTPPKQLVPSKYTDVNSSGLEFEVKPGNNTIDLALKSK
jgi:hypothetical protein